MIPKEIKCSLHYVGVPESYELMLFFKTIFKKESTGPVA